MLGYNSCDVIKCHLAATCDACYSKVLATLCGISLRFVRDCVFCEIAGTEKSSTHTNALGKLHCRSVTQTRTCGRFCSGNPGWNARFVCRVRMKRMKRPANIDFTQKTPSRRFCKQVEKSELYCVKCEISSHSNNHKRINSGICGSLGSKWNHFENTTNFRDVLNGPRKASAICRAQYSFFLYNIWFYNLFAYFILFYH